MIPKTIAVEDKYEYFSSDLYKTIENKKNEERTSLKFTNHNVDPYDHQLAKCREGAFEMTECNQIHSFHPNEEAEEVDEEEDNWVEEQRSLDKPTCCSGNNPMEKNFNQKCGKFV